MQPWQAYPCIDADPPCPASQSTHRVPVAPWCPTSSAACRLPQIHQGHPGRHNLHTSIQIQIHPAPRRTPRSVAGGFLVSHRTSCLSSEADPPVLPRQAPLTQIDPALDPPQRTQVTHHASCAGAGGALVSHIISLLSVTDQPMLPCQALTHIDPDIDPPQRTQVAHHASCAGAGGVLVSHRMSLTSPTDPAMLPWQVQLSHIDQDLDPP